MFLFITGIGCMSMSVLCGLNLYGMAIGCFLGIGLLLVAFTTSNSIQFIVSYFRHVRHKPLTPNRVVDTSTDRWQPF